ncbi:MAG: hypothetical protein KDH09_17000, partial [Chrysiogenetes bacterium]|nr:hypothetical protein [Chrysiogenetes bacterium]
MLIDDYLSDYQVSYRHSIVIDAPAERVFPIVQKFDLSNAALLRFLFWIRSIPAKLKGQDLLGATLADLQKGGLLVLGTDSQHEFLLGFV